MTLFISSKTFQEITKSKPPMRKGKLMIIFGYKTPQRLYRISLSLERGPKEYLLLDEDGLRLFENFDLFLCNSRLNCNGHWGCAHILNGEATRNQTKYCHHKSNHNLGNRCCLTWLSVERRSGCSLQITVV